MSILTEERITIAEASQLSGLDRKVLYELFEIGEIKGYQWKQKAKIFIFKSSLENYLNKIKNLKV